MQERGSLFHKLRKAWFFSRKVDNGKEANDTRRQSASGLEGKLIRKKSCKGGGDKEKRRFCIIKLRKRRFGSPEIGIMAHQKRGGATKKWERQTKL